MLSYLMLILRSGLRSRRRSVLTIMGIAASFCMLGVLAAMYILFYRTAPTGDQALRLIVRNRISFANPIPISYLNKVRALPGVREVMVQQWFGGTYKDPRDPSNNFARFAIEPAKLFLMHPDYSIPQSDREAFIARRDSCILGRPLAERLRLKTGDRLTLVGDIFPITLNLVVTGLYESATDNDGLYFHNQYLNESLRKAPDFTLMLMVLVDRVDLVNSVPRMIDAEFRNSAYRTKTETEKGFRLSFMEYVGNVKLFLVVVCASLTGIVLLVSANTMAMSVRERAVEVGVLKALGFSPFAIRLLIVGEAMVSDAGRNCGHTTCRVTSCWNPNSTGDDGEPERASASPGRGHVLALRWPYRFRGFDRTGLGCLRAGDRRLFPFR